MLHAKMVEQGLNLSDTRTRNKSIDIRKDLAGDLVRDLHASLYSMK